MSVMRWFAALPAQVRTTWRAALQRDVMAVLLGTLLLVFPFSAGAQSATTRVATSSGTTSSTGSSSITVAYPSGTASGDLIIAAVVARGGSGTTITPGSGWTLIRSDSRSSAGRVSVYFRVVTGSDTPSVSFALSPSVVGAAALSTYRGVDVTNPIQDSTVRANSSSSTIRADEVSPTVANSMLVGVFGAATGGLITGPSSMSEAVEVVRSGSTTAAGAVVLIADQVVASAGRTGDRNATVSPSAESVGILLALRPGARLTAEYRFDECTYTDSANEVRDSVGTAHGTPRNGVTSEPSGEVGRAAGFDKFDRWVSVSTRLESTWSVSAWVKLPLTVDSGSQYHVLAAISGGGDLLYLDNRNNFRWGVYTTSSTVDGTYQFGSLADGWHHVALVASGGRTTLYVDGSSVDSVGIAVGAGTIAYVGTSFDYVDTATAQGWRGAIDEFQVWNGALTASEIRNIFNNQGAGNNYDGTRRAAVSCGPARFTVTASATASTCAAHSVTITAVDGSGSVVTTYTGTINLTTSTSRGSWAAGPSSGTVTETGTANDGAASYTFRSADLGSVTLLLTNQSADTLTITATDSSNSAVNGVSGSVAFRDNAFVITATDSLSTTAVAARPHAMTATLFRRDTSLPTPNCSIATNYTGARNLKAWYTTDTSHPAGASAPAINGGSALGTAVPGSNNVALTFTAGVATFNLTTTDVGKYTVSLRDDSRTFAGAVNIDGTSPTLTVRPFAIAITGVAKGATANPEGTATSGSRFIAAGDTFSATVSGYLWATGDDANNDGTPDAGANFLNNGLAPRFAWATTLSTASTSGLFTPSGGNLGTLGGTTSIASGSFSGGSATVSNLTYSEVGSVSLTATATSYLNTSGVTLTGTVANATTGQTARVGRFYPSHFALASGAAVTPSCSSGGFTYMDEPALGVRFTLEARNLADAITTNYRASVYNVGTVSLAAENADAGTDLGARVTGLPSATWTLGQYVVNATGATFSRLTAPDGPFDSLILGVAVTDADGAVITSRDMNASTAGACSGACTARALNPSAATRVRFGRLRVGNALGSPQLELPVPLTAEYWTGVGFATNSLDGCTRLTNTQFAFSNYRAPLAACATSGSPTGSSGIAFSSGRGTLRLSRPATTGSVDLTPNLGASASGNTCSGGASSAATAASRTWLQGNWGASTYDRNPTARAVFGLHNRSQDVIFSRESY